MPSNAIDRLRTALAGRYAIEQEAGRGGMAVVYRARDLRHARTVAIKVFGDEFAARGDDADRFLREIRIAAQLAHPHVLPLHDSGEVEASGADDSGLLYYVMPFVAGPSLRDRLRAEKQLPVEDAVRIARTVAAALDHAHRHDVLHRDVKPENILLQDGEAVVADFGIARALRGAAGDTRTLPGLALGTPAYMSPEQATGDEHVDARSDQYALACVVFEMLAGQPPFVGGNLRATLLQHIQAPPPSLRALRPEVPPGLERAIARALSKQPDERFASLAEFGDALGASRTGGELAVEIAATRSVAVLPFVNASSDPDNEYFSDGMTDELIHLLAQVDGLRVAPRTSVFALKGQQLDVRSVGTRLGVLTVLEGSVRKAGGRLRITAQLSDAESGRLLWSERFDRDDRDVFAIQEDLARTIVATLRADLLGTLGDPVPRRYTRNLVAYNHYLRGRHCWNKRNQDGITEAIEYFERAIAEDPGYALAYTGLSDAYALQIDYRRSPVADGMRRAREMAVKALALDDTLAEAHTSLAWVLFIHDWDWERAAEEFRRAIDLNPRYATARQWYSWFLAATGSMEEGLAEGRRAVSLDPSSVSIQRGIGWLYYYARQSQRAEQELQRALVLDPNQIETHLVVALVRFHDGDLEGADGPLAQALTLAPDDTASLALKARIAVQRDDWTTAREIEARFVEMARHRYVSPTDQAKLQVALRNVDGAFAAIERAYQERRGWLAYLAIEPLLEPLHDDPRFDLMLQRMRLPKPRR